MECSIISLMEVPDYLFREVPDYLLVKGAFDY